MKFNAHINSRLAAFTQSRKAPWLIAALFVLFGCVASLQTPLYQGYDEGWHYAYVEHYALGRPLPNLNLHFTTGDVAAPYWQTHEASQPPLYYLLMGRIAALVPREDLIKTQVLEGDSPNGMYGNFLPADRSALGSGLALAGHLVRIATVLMGAAVVVCAYFITLNVVQRADVALLVCAMTAFNPRMIVLSAQVSNDMAVACTASLSLWLATVIVTTQSNVNWKHTALLGVGAGASLLMKYSGGAVVVAAVVALACRAWRFKLSGRWLMMHMAAFGVGALWVTGWYFWRNGQLYGNVLAWNAINAMNTKLPAPRTAQYLLSQLPYIISTYFAHPAYMLPLPSGYTAFMFYLMGVAAVGVIGLAVRRRTGKALWFVYWPLLAALGVNIVTHVAWMRWHPDTENTRFLSPTFVPITLLFVLGLLAFVPRRWHGVLAAIVPVVYGLFTGITLYIGFNQMYARPNYLNVTESDYLLSQPSAGRVMFENGIELVDVQLKNNRLNVGEPIALRIVWRATRPLTQSAHLMLDVRDEHEQTLAFLNTSTVVRYSYVPRAWEVGELVREEYILTPPMNRNQIVRVLAGWFWMGSQQTPIRPINKDGARNAVSVEVARVKLHVPAAMTDVVSPPMAHIEGLADLLSAEQVADGVVLRWRAIAEPAQNYTIFVHGLDAQEQIVTQSDVPFEYAATFWNKDEVFEQKIWVKNLNQAQMIQIGVYEPVSLQRLHAVGGDGSALRDDAVVMK